MNSGQPRFRAVSQLLWFHKGREEWFSLAENHEKATWLPRISCAMHYPRETMCGFLYGKPHAVR